MPSSFFMILVKYRIMSIILLIDSFIIWWPSSWFPYRRAVYCIIFVCRGWCLDAKVTFHSCFMEYFPTFGLQFTSLRRLKLPNNLSLICFTLNIRAVFFKILWGCVKVWMNLLYVKHPCGLFQNIVRMCKSLNESALR